MDGSTSEPASVTLDIDDTATSRTAISSFSLFNGFYDERCFLPIHVYDTGRSAAGGRRAAPRQDAWASRCAPTCAAWCATSGCALLEDHGITSPGRWPLRAARSDGLVRGERRGLRVRADRDAGAGEESRRDGRRRVH